MRDNIIKIMRTIEKKELTLSEISEKLKMSYQLVSRYTKLLRICSFVEVNLIEKDKGNLKFSVKITEKGIKAIKGLNDDLIELINL